MAYQSIWYYTDLPEDIVDIIERDVTETFDSQMADSRLHGDALNKEKRNSQNAWIPTHHWLGGFLWHYIQRANRENFLYDLRCIDGESMQYTRYGEGQFYGWHNDAGLAGQYKPVSVGNRTDGLGQDFRMRMWRWFVNYLLRCNSLIPMIMRVVTFSCLMKEVAVTLFPVSVERLYCLTHAQCTEF
tara:strand:- start:1554 stop:2111 length:558 start_codon:yes stop_codon:yes gene_type:complete